MEYSQLAHQAEDFVTLIMVIIDSFAGGLTRY